MVVEVILGQVGEDADIKIDSECALQGNGVGGNLHHRTVAARLPHLLEQGLDIRSLRRGMRCRKRAITDLIRDRTEQTGKKPAVAQHIANHVGRSGLPVGSGHSDDLHLARKIAMVSVCNFGQCPACARNPDVCNLCPEVKIVLGYHGNRAI